MVTLLCRVATLCLLLSLGLCSCPWKPSSRRPSKMHTAEVARHPPGQNWLVHAGFSASHLRSLRSQRRSAAVKHDSSATPSEAFSALLRLGPYQPPGPADRRSPCPGFNTMANHGVFPRDGSAVSLGLIVRAFRQFYGYTPTFTNLLMSAVFKGGTGNASAKTVTLVQLRAHNVVEHDASLVRDDFYFGTDFYYKVNATLFNQLLAMSSDNRSLSMADMGRFRAQRLAFCRATNPTLRFAKTEFTESFGEAATLQLVLGRLPGLRMPLASVRYFLLEERLPPQFRPAHRVGLPEVEAVIQRIARVAGAL